MERCGRVAIERQIAQRPIRRFGSDCVRYDEPSFDLAVLLCFWPGSCHLYAGIEMPAIKAVPRSMIAWGLEEVARAVGAVVPWPPVRHVLEHGDHVARVTLACDAIIHVRDKEEVGTSAILGMVPGPPQQCAHKAGTPVDDALERRQWGRIPVHAGVANVRARPVGGGQCRRPRFFPRRSFCFQHRAVSRVCQCEADCGVREAP